MSKGGVPVKSWLAIAGALLGAFMAILDIQITNSSLKDIQAALGATSGIDSQLIVQLGPPSR